MGIQTTMYCTRLQSESIKHTFWASLLLHFSNFFPKVMDIEQSDIQIPFCGRVFFNKLLSIQASVMLSFLQQN